MSGHMTSTWLWTNLLHPLIMFLYFNEGTAPFDPEIFGVFILAFIYSLVFSLPSLFMALLAGYLITRIRSSVAIQFLVWVLVAPLLVVLNVAGLELLSGENDLTLLEFGLAIPGIIAVLIVVLLRYRLFFKACELRKGVEEKKTEYDEIR